MSSPTIRQLAALAGVCKSTVSLALHNHPSLPVETRERIKRLAAEAGYHIDPVVAGLMRQLRTPRGDRPAEKLAYLTLWNTRNGWRRERNDRLYFEGASTRAREMGYELEHFWAKEPGITGSRLSRILHTRAFRGVIIGPTIQRQRHLTLRWQNFCIAAISGNTLKPDLHRSTHCHFQGMTLTLRRLKQHGYRRVGLVLTQEQCRRTPGWLAAYLSYPVEFSRFTCLPALLAVVHERNRFSDWLRKYQPEVVISNHTDILNFLVELDVPVPDEVGYATLDRSEVDETLAGIDQDPSAIGAAAVDLVVTQLQNNETGVPAIQKSIQISGRWHEGLTLRSLDARHKFLEKGAPARGPAPK